MVDRENNPTDMRMSNIELLRIVAMIMIIAYHIPIHLNFTCQPHTITVSQLWNQFILMGGKIGVNIFVLISGYFLINSNGIKISKIIKLWLQIFTYSVLIYIIFTISGLEPFSIKAFIKSMLPITYEGWWFASTYFVLYLISPFLNIFLKALNKKNYQRYLAVVIILWCLIPTVTGQNFEGNNLLWFICLYSVAAYIRLWHDEADISVKSAEAVESLKSEKSLEAIESAKSSKLAKRYFCLAFVFIVLTFLLVVILDFCDVQIADLSAHEHLYEMNKLPIFLISLFMFMGFKGLNIHYNKAINLIASATFGVYLIHDSKSVSWFIWIVLFSNISNLEKMIIPYSIGAVFLVFIICTCIELLRIFLLERHYMKIINKSIDKRCKNHENSPNRH
ncbi:MAG: acyltransferase [Clostridiales bacterium]|nr:acyltransferase [Clostridiales bacterium]